MDERFDVIVLGMGWEEGNRQLAAYGRYWLLAPAL